MSSMHTDRKLIDVLAIGETMLRLAPVGGARLEQATQLEATFGGAESNVAANLSRLGKRSAWYSRLPNNPLGRRLAASLRSQGVLLDQVTWVEEGRLGVYYVEYGPEPRPIQVWYDRVNSAASLMTPDELPLGTIRESRWIHTCGITTALSAGCLATVRQAVNYAKEHNAIVSIDVNYRAKLWEPATAHDILSPLCMQADCVFVARRDAHQLWGIADDPVAVAETLGQRWGGTVIVTDGDDAVAGYRAGETAMVSAMPAKVVDRLGAGDAFAAGVIMKFLEDASLQDALRFGTALAAIKLTIPGDVAIVTREEVEAIVSGAKSALRR